MLAPMSLDASYFNNVISAFLSLSTRFNTNLRSSTPNNRLPHPDTQRASPDHLSPPFAFPCRPVDLSTVAAFITSYACPLTSIADSRTTGQPNSIIGIFQETVCRAGSH